MEEAIVTFEDKEKTKKVVFNIKEENNLWDMSIEFIPEIKTKDKLEDLYQRLAATFLDILEK